MRPYGGYFYNLGRETFLVPVRWEDDWPVLSPGTGRVESSYPAPDLPEKIWPAAPDCDDFNSPDLALQWNFLRTPAQKFWSLTERPGFLRLHLRPESLSELGTPSFVGRRQQHINCSAQILFEFTPLNELECAGLALIQNERFHFALLVTRTTETVVRLVKRAQGLEEILAEQPIHAGRFFLKVEAHAQAYGFYFAVEPDLWRLLAENVDGRILSTPVAGGFLGTWIGMYASSNGLPGMHFVDFDSFTYTGNDGN
jgi:alpha-N-arabinofuranosidase